MIFFYKTLPKYMYVKVKCVKLPKFILHFQIWALEVPKYVVLMIQYRQKHSSYLYRGRQYSTYT